MNKIELFTKVRKYTKVAGIATLVITIAVLGASLYSTLNVIDKMVATPKIELPEIRLEQMQSIELIATGYAVGHPYNNVAKSGVPAINLGFMRMDGVNFFTVAVDEKIIPLGTLLYIEGLGIAWASDTGPAIQGLKIDICFQTPAQATQFGKQKVKVYMLKTSATDENILAGRFTQ